jgi:hypothetical protein
MRIRALLGLSADAKATAAEAAQIAREHGLGGAPAPKSGGCGAGCGCHAKNAPSTQKAH